MKQAMDRVTFWNKEWATTAPTAAAPIGVAIAVVSAWPSQQPLFNTSKPCVIQLASLLLVHSWLTSFGQTALHSVLDCTGRLPLALVGANGADGSSSGHKS